MKRGLVINSQLIGLLDTDKSAARMINRYCKFAELVELFLLLPNRFFSILSVVVVKGLSLVVLFNLIKICTFKPVINKPKHIGEKKRRDYFFHANICVHRYP